MQQYTIDNNNYFIFDQSSAEHMVYFLWGKFDFRAYLHKVEESAALKNKQKACRDNEGGYYIIKKLQHRVKEEWYDFKRVTSHGFTFEETKWENGTKLHYAEFPRELMAIATQVTAKELGMTPLTPPPLFG